MEEHNILVFALVFMTIATLTWSVIANIHDNPELLKEIDKE